MAKEYKVYHVNKNTYFEVEAGWLEGVKLQGAVKIDFLTFPQENLIVTYYGGKEVAYQNVHGTWGFPTNLR